MSRSRCAHPRATRRRRAIVPAGEPLESRQVLSVAGATPLQCEGVEISSSDMLMWSSEPYFDESSADALPSTSSDCQPIDDPLLTIPIDDDVDPLAACPGLDEAFCLPEDGGSESTPPVESEPYTTYPDLDDPRVIRRLFKGARDTGLVADELWSLIGDELP